MLKYRTVPVTPFQQNCSILWCEKTRKAAVVDPGGEVPRILEVVRSLDVNLEKILLTHGHMDHVGGTADLARELNIPIIGPHIADAFWINALDQQAAMMGFERVEGFQSTQWLQDGDSVDLGEVLLDVVHCPGHTPGHVIFVSQRDKKAFVGDVLFNGSIGRTDFPKSNHSDLLYSIRNKLWPLGDDISFVPGHGPESTFGEERSHNPFVADSRFG